MNMEAMKSQTIGVEVEMNSIRRDTAAQIAADLFGTGRYEHTSFGCYQTWTAWDQQGRKWQFMKDSSIGGPDYYKCEMVTPILKYDDIELLQELCRRLRKAGAKSDPSRGCGVHIHIGAKGHDPKTIRNLVNLMASHEGLVAKSIGIADSRLNRWCKVVNPIFLDNINKKKPNTMADLADVWYESHGSSAWGRSEHYNNSRYHMLNLHATFTKGTIEFRCFQFDAPRDGKQNGIHAGQLKAYIQFCLALSQMAKEAKSASPRQRWTDNPKKSMNAWLTRMGFVGAEFKTARQMLTKKLVDTSTALDRAV